MANRLQSQVTIITGAGSRGPGWGTGRATAVLFAREGARVLAVDLSAQNLNKTLQVISAEGGEAASFVADVSRSQQVKALIEHCEKIYGRIDILVNNVGVLTAGGPEDLPEEVWDRHISVNAKSVFLTCKYVLPIMVRQGRGAIVNISSIASIRYTGYPSVAYNASKGTVNQVTQNIAVQYARNGIRANNVLPGLLNTPMIREPLARVYGEGGIEEMIRVRDQQVPMGMMGDAWDVAYASLFLASDEAKYITGANLVVDGGLSCKCS